MRTGPCRLILIHIKSHIIKVSLTNAGTCIMHRCNIAPFQYKPTASRPGRQPCLATRAAAGTGTQGKKVEKVVLAYSGGLDTSVILTWLQETYNCEVVTFTADLGQVCSDDTSWSAINLHIISSGHRNFVDIDLVVQIPIWMMFWGKSKIKGEKGKLWCRWAACVNSDLLWCSDAVMQTLPLPSHLHVKYTKASIWHALEKVLHCKAPQLEPGLEQRLPISDFQLFEMHLLPELNLSLSRNSCEAKGLGSFFG